MIISEEKYCIASKTFPLMFYRCANETNKLEYDVLRSESSCKEELGTYCNPEEFQILKVKVTYEL